MIIQQHKRRTGILAGVLMVSVLAAQTAHSEVISDDFADGTRNTILWRKAAFDDGAFQETGGHLALRTVSASPSFLVSGWSANFDRTYDGKDTIDIRALVRAPHKIKKEGKSYELGIGLYQSRADHNYIELTVLDSVSNRQFGVYYHSDTTTKDEYFTFPAPTNINVYVLRMRYKTELNKIFLYWTVPGSSTWHSIGSASFVTMFDRIPPHVMRPYVVSYIDDTLVPLTWGIYLDDFIAVYRNVPLLIE